MRDFGCNRLPPDAGIFKRTVLLTGVGKAKILGNNARRLFTLANRIDAARAGPARWSIR